ncbi:MAG: type 1 glutamine amidotransferase, partial [Merismopedia sp. SIO2A8]|nr:type 1 glutamine amidotransferase [Merismopedia sp. SIO2A8]
KPIMGVCLGAQLIARAFGSQVYRHTQPELGFSPIHVVDSSIASEPWLQNCPNDLHLMQWHFDTFDLPSEATLLMTNNCCVNQAYRIGTNIYGFQFHLEITPAIALGWLEMKSAWIEAYYPHLEQQIRNQVDTYAAQSAQFAQSIVAAWLAS